MALFKNKAPASYNEILCDRAVNICHLSSPDYNAAEVVLAITHKNQSQELIRAISSALKQTLVENLTAKIVILDDQSEPLWQDELQHLLHHPAITLISAECGSPARARNLLLDWADNQPMVKWVARLDADDELYAIDSLEQLWRKACGVDAVAAIGSNLLRQQQQILPEPNIANPDELLLPTRLATFINTFAGGGQSRELPSCNLLLRTGLGYRYPNIRSAEDHWLVCSLLMSHPQQVAILSYPIYSIYSLDGADSKQNQQDAIWSEQRQRLAYIADKWSSLLTTERELIGLGMEGVVWKQHGRVIKEFYPWAISDNEIASLKVMLTAPNLPIPKIRWRHCNTLWQYDTPWLEHRKIGKFLPLTTIINYLSTLYRARISTLNIKRDNLILTDDGVLQYIDIGKDIQPLTTSNFLDMSARLYSIGILGNSDEEVVRRYSLRRQDASLDALPGFSDFYKELISTLHPSATHSHWNPPSPSQSVQVTLLIKACGQDAAVLSEQVAHIVSQLSYPVAFTRRILLIDPHQDAFLRQYADGDLDSVLKQAAELKTSSLIDDFWVAPTSHEMTLNTYHRWFGTQDCHRTHTTENAPLFPQIWGFDQVDTRYVLQCDLDVMIGRRDWQHDYLADMLYACEPQDVLAVGFNIPKIKTAFTPYHGEPGQFAPEVRFGLLDLHRIRSQLPLENPLLEDAFSLTWHRALQRAMKQRGLRALRGGDPASYYVHPRNEHKHLLEIARARDLIAQGQEPLQQQEQFDWIPGDHWQYPSRNEPLVFLLKGRFTEPGLLQRCLLSLSSQTNQNFGLILIDDASGAAHNWCYPMLLGELAPKTTLIRHALQQGRMRNFILAIKQICSNLNTLIAVLDQDDCLMQTDIVDTLLQARKQGADLIQMPMFRPNKPLRLYIPDYQNPRAKAASNVWSHLRVFTKALFEQVPESYFRHPSTNEWFDTVTDYLTMLPMAELARAPKYIDRGYVYWHLRKDYGENEKEREEELIGELLNMTALA